mgnify:CR=1 FL=1
MERHRFNSIVLVAFCLFLVSGAILSHAEPLSNEFVFSNAVETAVSEVIDSLRLSPGRLRIVRESGIDGLAADALAAAMVKSGWIIAADSDSSFSADLFESKIRLSAFRFAYEKAGSRGLLKKPDIRRHLRGQIYMSLLGPVDFVGYRAFEHSDTIRYEEANYVASRRYKELNPELFVSGAGRYLEPAVVISAVGALVFLFFNSR